MTQFYLLQGVFGLPRTKNNDIQAGKNVATSTKSLEMTSSSPDFSEIFLFPLAFSVKIKLPDCL